MKHLDNKKLIIYIIFIMPRYPRLTAPHVFYHIFNRGIEKRDIFREEKDYLKFSEYLIKYQKKFDWIIYCYCLMPNHFHLLIQTGKHPLANIMRSLQTAYGVFFNKKYQRVGPVFCGRYKSIICQKGEYFLQVSKYIHLNPVKSNLSSTPLDYLYSSYQEYIRGRNTFLGKNIIDRRAMKRIVGENLSEKEIKVYQFFVEEKEDLFEYNIEDKSLDVFGNQRFVTKYKQNIKV